MPTVCRSCGCSCVTECTTVTGCSSQQPGASVTFVLGAVTYGPCLTTGTVTSITRVAAGTGYTSVPTVTIGGNGASNTTPAAATAVLSTTSIASLSLAAGGTGFTDTATVSFSYGNATATAALTPTTVASVTRLTGGTGYVTPTVTISGGGGTGATARTITAGGLVTGLTLLTGGSGYTSNPTVTINNDAFGGTGATATASRTGTVVTGLTLGLAGSGYYQPTVTISGGGGSGAAAKAIIEAGAVTGFNVTAAGSGYTSRPSISVGASPGFGIATGQVVLVATSVASVSLTSAGNNYTATSGAPTVTIAGTGGTGATATATLNTFTIASFTVTNIGAGYDGTPLVTISGGGGHGAAGTAVMTASCCLALGVAGTYTRTVTKSGFTTNTGTVTLACSSSVHNSTVAMAVPSGSACGAVTCCPPNDFAPGQPHPNFTFPSTLYANDGQGLITLARVGTTNSWQGTYTRTGAGAYSTCGTLPHTVNPAASVELIMTVTCTGTSGSWAWSVEIDFGYCSGDAGGLGCIWAGGTFSPYPAPLASTSCRGSILGSKELFSCFPIAGEATTAGTITGGDPFFANNLTAIYGSPNVHVTFNE